ncbi:MAG: sodium:proton exchanger, partial [Rhodanobacteraceae bacterium]
MVGGSALLVAAAGTSRFTDAGAVIAFLCSGLAVALLAALVGRSVEQLGDRFGAGATGVLQSALGNLPELFIALFALRAGLVMVVQAALIGSILANLLLVLGLAFTVGGLRHGPQNIDSQRARSTTVQMLLAVAAMVVPSLASYVHAPAAPHEDALSLAVSIILLALFAVTLPASLKRKSAGDAAEQHEPPRWPLPLALALLAAAAVAAAFVSEWFVHALEPAMRALGISEAFAGLVIVAIAGNA